MIESLPRLKPNHSHRRSSHSSQVPDISPLKNASSFLYNKASDSLATSNALTRNEYIPTELKSQAKFHGVVSSLPTSPTTRRTRSTRTNGNVNKVSMVLKPKLQKNFQRKSVLKTVRAPTQEEEEIQIEENSFENPVEKSQAIIPDFEMKAEDYLGTVQTTMLTEENKTSLNNSPSRKTYDLENKTDEELRELALVIFQKPMEARSPKDIEILMKCLSVVEFFKTYDNRTIKSCLRYMQYRTANRGETVFEIGEKGTTFWIILKGSISVWTYENKVVKNEETGEEKVVRDLAKTKVQGAGSAFGELSLLERKPRAATIKCEEDCHFGILERAPFKAILKNREAQKLFAEINFLSSLHMFKEWSYNAVKQLHYYLPVIKCRRGQVLYNEGDPSPTMYIVRSGEFKVLKQIGLENENDFELRNQQNKAKKLKPFARTFDIAILSEKELFGEEEFMHDIKRKYKVVCHSQEAEIYKISRKEYNNPRMTFSVSEKWLHKNISSKKKHYEERILNFQRANKLNSHLLVFKKDEFPLKSRSPSPTQANLIKPQINKSVILNEDNERMSDGYTVTANASILEPKELYMRKKVPRHLSQCLESKTRLDGSVIFDGKGDREGSNQMNSYRLARTYRAVGSTPLKRQLQPLNISQPDQNGLKSDNSFSAQTGTYSRKMKNSVIEINRNKLQLRVEKAITKKVVQNDRSFAANETHFFDVPLIENGVGKSVRGQKSPRALVESHKLDISIKRKGAKHLRANSMVLEEKMSDFVSSEAHSMMIQTPRKPLDGGRDEVLVQGLRQKLAKLPSGEEWNSVMGDDPFRKKTLSYTLYNEIIDKLSPKVETNPVKEGFFPSTPPRTLATRTREPDFVRMTSRERLTPISQKSSITKHLVGKIDGLNKNNSIIGDPLPIMFNKEKSELRSSFLMSKKTRILKELITSKIELGSLEYVGSFNVERNRCDNV